MGNRSAAVIVLGDLVRSPRMLRHAEALAGNGFEVDLIGFRGSHPLEVDGRIRVHEIEPLEHGREISPILLLAAMAVRQLRLAASLFRRLSSIPRPAVMLVQNPPALPALAVAVMVGWRRGVPLVVDWHNTTEEMLRLRMHQAAGLVGFVGWLETRLGRSAAGHLAVSNALAAVVAKRTGQPATVLYDRAPAGFHPLDGAERERVRSSLPGDVPQGAALVVCPTSWTGDDDFSLLIRAAGIYEASSFTRPLAFVMTGDGERREAVRLEIESFRWQKVRFLFRWFSRSDFSRVLAAADLGVSIHRSSSEIDLPIKLAEMRAAALPAAVLRYGAVLDEVVEEGRSGISFEDADGLAEILALLASGDQTLPSMRSWMVEHPPARWEGDWLQVAGPLLVRVANG